MPQYLINNFRCKMDRHFEVATFYYRAIFIKKVGELNMQGA
jgi:hypothetical protein